MPKTLPRTIRVTDVGEYIRHHSCARRFALGYDNQKLFKALPFIGLPYHTMDPVLAAQGKRREADWALALQDRGMVQLDLPEDEPGKGASFDVFAEMLADHAVEGLEVFAREVQIDGRIGAFALFGRIDFVVLRWRDGAPVVWLIECKASRRDRTYQHAQVVLYQMIVRQLLAEVPLIVCGRPVDASAIEVAVVRIDEATNQMMTLDALTPLTHTEQLEHDIARMLREGGPLTSALTTPLDALAFRLEGKCDGCVFNIHCLTESARQRRLELLGLAPDRVRALERVGVGTIDALAALPPSSAAAEAIRLDPEFTADLETLHLKALTRCVNLPPRVHGEEVEERRAFDVEVLPHRGYGHLPLHDLYDVEEARGKTWRQLREENAPTHRLMRVFLSVHYDYAENRVGALAAHLTTSDGDLHTPFERVEGKARAAAGVVEIDPDAPPSEHGASPTRPLRGETIVEIKQGEWTGRYEADCAVEQALLRSFLGKLVRQVQLTAPADKVPLHFYVWSSREITTLLEACERVGGGMLRYVRELFGCRESLEQLIFSSLEHELRTRYATAWTGQGLSVVTSLRWFGRRFHWRRQVGRRVVDLDREMERDLFDFRSRLHMNRDGDWVARAGADTTTVMTEVRARFYDSLSAPYWRAYWDTLPDPDRPGEEVAASLKGALRQYLRARRPGVLEAYLGARTHALRWLEERVKLRNREIKKAPLDLSALPTFKLDTDDPAAAAVDYLRLDQHVKFAAWLQTLLQPPYLRVATGASLPIKDLRLLDDNGKHVRGTLDPVPYYTSLEMLRTRTSLEAGKWVRMHNVRGTPREPQSMYDLLVSGKTCRVTALDWERGTIDLAIVPSPSRASRNDYYTLKSVAFVKHAPFASATLDDSITNFVDARVERRLSPSAPGAAIEGAHVQAWFDPARPKIPPQTPLPADRAEALRRLLAGLTLPLGDGERVAILPERVEVILRGLGARIQLIQGPPGTGKTMVTALAILTRALARGSSGDVVLVAAHTHTAVDTLLRRIDRVMDDFAEAARAMGLEVPPMTLGKVFSSKGQAEESEVGGRVTSFVASGSWTTIKEALKGGVVVLGSTTGAMLKLADDLGKKTAYKNLPDRFQTSFLVVDEASMMVFAHLLALATLLKPDGELLLAGDHRQLAPIAAHDWDREDRPPAQRFRMHESAFDAISRLRAPDEEARKVMKVRLSDAQIRRDGLETTFRLPPDIRRLIQPLYDRDDLTLKGPAGEKRVEVREVAPTLEALWTSRHSLYLVLHEEQASRQQNVFEAHLIRHILDAGLDGPGVGEGSVVVMTPHRAQRARLKTMLADYGDVVRLVDTVERMQGGESETVIYSATVSDPTAIADETEFLLDIERTNVAFSRTKRRLFVICPRTLIDFVPPKLEDYQTAMLWKHLRTLCTTEIAGGELGRTPYRVLVCDARPRPR